VKDVKEVKKVQLVFETEPAHAEVFEDDALIGATPITLEQDPGKTVSLRFELKGYKPLVRKVRFEQDDAVKIRLEPIIRKGPAKKPGGLHDDPYSNVKELKDLPD
jgi:hypothetical protein